MFFVIPASTKIPVKPSPAPGFNNVTSSSSNPNINVREIRAQETSTMSLHHIWSSPASNAPVAEHISTSISSSSSTSIHQSNKSVTQKEGDNLQPKQMTDAQFLKHQGYLSMYDFMSFYGLKTWRTGDEAAARTILYALRDRAQERHEAEKEGAGKGI
jgi:hypothetical protein